uniref:Uncharacterized protein n=1 Tax=Candidatus Kentrum sp. LFY TaxID=2126342 RepID=A0A450V5I7_9GAMM|nr:MAG: hypothetical protein BECKLFY1418A_GA0070994_11102 [Candidatus Kentron sp. LFY]
MGLVTQWNSYTGNVALECVADTLASVVCTESENESPPYLFSKKHEAGSLDIHFGEIENRW